VTVLEHALIYADRDWPFIPLHWPTKFGPKKGPDRAECSCRRDDCESQGKHPLTPNGLKDASTDPAVIKAWLLNRWPKANGGLLAGVHFDVQDIDGDDALDALAAAEPDDVPEWSGPIVTTGRGVHQYVAPTGVGNRAGFLPGIDWRGRGGYVVAPPSVHYLHGDLYQWGETFTMDRAIEPCPPWLLSLVRRDAIEVRPQLVRSVPSGQTASDAKRIDGVCGRVAMAREGERNHMLNWAAHTLGRAVVEDGLDLHDAVNGLMVAASRVGLSEREAVRTIESGLRAAGVRWGQVA
jgi:Bifunctional DNA primase/polymerase, N-terminal